MKLLNVTPLDIIENTTYLNGKKATKSILAIFFIIYCLISLVNHFTFKTYAWDLGINNNAIWDYSHFRWNDCMLIDGPKFDNILSDHLTLYPVLVSPLIFIFGTYTMLVFQIFMVLFGGYGIFKCIKLISNDSRFANLGLIYFFSLWGVYSALSFDYHDNVAASMLVPWIFYNLMREKFGLMFLFTFLLLIGKENMALWAVFISIGLVVRFYKEPVKRWASLGIGALAIIYFYLAVNIIIPSFSNAGRGYLHFNYSALGINFKEALMTVLMEPLYVLKLLWTNHTGEIDAIGIKTELHIVFFLSGGLLLFLRPAYLIMLVPIYAQKLFNDDYVKWGINAHYSIEFIPVLAFGVFDILHGKFSKNHKKMSLAFGVVLLAIVVNVWKMEGRTSKWYAKENTAFYSKKHYFKEFDITEVHKALKLIPDDVSVKASEALVPHLAFREIIYQFPLGPETDYIVLLDHERTFPLSREKLLIEIENLKKDKNWITVYQYNSLYIFKRATMK